MPAAHQPTPEEHLDVGGPASSGQQRPRWVAVTAVVVLVALALGGLGGFLIARGSTSSASADNSVATACGIVAQLQEQGTPTDWNLESPQMWRAMGVGPLFQAAALEDPQYAELGEAGQQVLQAVQSLDRDSYATAMDTITQHCADI